MAEVFFYERPVPLNRSAHKDLRLKGMPSLKFAANVHSVPLTGTEFPAAARDVPILFAGTDVKDAGPMALLGLRRQRQNAQADQADHELTHVSHDSPSLCAAVPRQQCTTWATVTQCNEILA